MRKACRSAILFSLAAVLIGCAGHPTRCPKSCPAETCDAAAPARVLRHVVLFKFKDDASPQDIQAVENAFKALPGKIDAIHDFEWGTDVSVENLAQGYTHCFLVTFLSEEDRAAYLPHPDHKAFGALLRPVLDKVLVIDYRAEP